MEINTYFQHKEGYVCEIILLAFNLNINLEVHIWRIELPESNGPSIMVTFIKTIKPINIEVETTNTFFSPFEPIIMVTSRLKQ